MKTLHYFLIISIIGLFSCNEQKSEEKTEDKKEGKQIEEKELEIITEQVDYTPEWINLAEHNEEYPVMMELPGGTSIVTLSFSGTFTGALEGSFSTKYLQIQIKNPYVFLNLYKGKLDLSQVKDSLNDLPEYMGLSIIEEYPEGIIVKRSSEENKEKFCLYETVQVNEQDYFVNTGFDVYNFDIKEYVDYNLEDIITMQKVFRTIKPIK